MNSNKQLSLAYKIQTEKWVPKKTEPWPLKKILELIKTTLMLMIFLNR